jgi:hypothetical protein
MKKNLLPDCARKRKVLNDGKLSAEQLIALGEAYRESDLLYDAAEFFRKASYDQGLVELSRLALEEGDSFLFGLTARGGTDEEMRKAWDELGRKAMALKKFSHAIRAFRKSGDEALLQQALEAYKEVERLDQA